MTGDAADREYMARALRLAHRGLFTADPNPRVGCVIVNTESSGRIVGEGWHERAPVELARFVEGVARKTASAGRG